MRQKANKLNRQIHTTDIRPGYLDTAMAKGEDLVWVAPVDKAGKQIYNAIARRKKIVYITKRWRLIAFIFKRIPAFIYCKFSS